MNSEASAGEQLFARFQFVHEEGARALQANQLVQAESCFAEALELSEYFASVEPRTDILGAYGSSLSNLAETLRRLGATPETEPLLIRAAEVFRSLVPRIPDQAEPALAQTLLALAKVYRGAQFYMDFGRPPLTDIDSMRAYRREKLAVGAWGGPMPTLVSEEWQANAEGPLVEAIQLLRRLARSNRSDFEPLLALALNLLGETFVNTRGGTGAEVPLREAEALYRGLVRDDPGAYQHMLTDTLSLLSQVTESGAGPSDRVSVLEELLPGLRSDAHITEREREIGVTMSKLGARDRLREALKELADLYKAAGESSKSDALWEGELGVLMTESLPIRWS